MHVNVCFRQTSRASCLTTARRQRRTSLGLSRHTLMTHVREGTYRSRVAHLRARQPLVQLCRSRRSRFPRILRRRRRGRTFFTRSASRMAKRNALCSGATQMWVLVVLRSQFVNVASPVRKPAPCAGRCLLSPAQTHHNDGVHSLRLAR